MSIRPRAPIRIFCFLTLFLTACATKQPAAVEEASAVPSTAQFLTMSAHSPPFASRRYEPFSRAEAVAIAQQEWRLFGQRVDDDPPRQGSDPGPADNPGHSPGFWERIGEYWWLGQDVDRRESAWTGMHDETGQEIDERRDDYYAWSAAFISYVMRTAGAGPRFPYAPAHYIYINVAKEMSLGRTSGWAIVAERPTDYAPLPGDLICFSRDRRPVKYDKLPARHFPAHCDIVVSRDKEQISVIGGNVDHAVTLKHVPVTSDGKLADPEGQVLDGRYPWLLVVRVSYDR
jgi:hypothetical protein